LLAQRVAVAAVGIPVIFVLVIVGGWPWAIACAAALAIASAEFQHFRYSWTSVQVTTGAASVAVVVLLVQAGGGWWAAGYAGVLVFIAAAAAPFRGDTHSDSALWIAFGGLYVGVLGSAFVLLRGLDNGRDWVLLALFGTFATDTAAYFVGRAIGKRPFAPRISPKKTWEGFFGGAAGGFGVVVAANYLLGIRIAPAEAAALGIIVPIAATAGDLFESWIKRRVGVKDASALIPGHGGALDRLDSVLFVFASVWVFAVLVVDA
jgi:phosphatidate cytidylyltransferase